MRVEEVMCRDVVTVSQSTPLKDVARILLERRISGLPVVDDEGRVVGVVSEGDIVSKERGVEQGAVHGYHWLFGPDDGEALKREARTAAEAMTSPAVVVRPQRSVAEAARLMVEQSVNRLPVVSEGNLVGIVEPGRSRSRLRPQRRGARGRDQGRRPAAHPLDRA